MSALCLRKSLQITGLVLHRLTCAWNAVRVALSPLVDACNRLRIPLFAPDSRGVYGLSNRSKSRKVAEDNLGLSLRRALCIYAIFKVRD